jgi:hypothetical protein
LFQAPPLLFSWQLSYVRGTIGCSFTEISFLLMMNVQL